MHIVGDLLAAADGGGTSGIKRDSYFGIGARVWQQRPRSKYVRWIGLDHICDGVWRLPCLHLGYRSLNWRDVWRAIPSLLVRDFCFGTPEAFLLDSIRFYLVFLTSS